MIAYSLYTMLTVGLAVLLTAVFRRLSREEQRVVPPEEDAAFEDRMRAIEADYGREADTSRDEGRGGGPGNLR